MTWILIEVFLLIFVFSAIIFILPIKLGVNFIKDGENEDFYIKICIIPGIFSFQVEMPLFKIHLNGFFPAILFQAETEGTSGQPIHKARVYVEKPWFNLKRLIEISPFYKAGILLRLFKRIFKVNKKFFKEIVCQRLIWKTSFGFGDPALTAMSAGGIWAAKSIFYINLQNNVQVNFHKPVYEVNPIFNRREFQVVFDCIFTFRFGHIITAGCKILIISVKSFFAQRG
ncbi:DUF2953 domain-containing protein [Desulfitibacter alkalitolerans]|uniref:DUF2953 domain-containing protein n=1 Tax=Desulfitibacter alkalitolerans TaxID=264641 RepID=UPI000483647D|nr:DUF2953 domain-containing protein [Desulfitibacter alkalitolerans]